MHKLFFMDIVLCFTLSCISVSNFFSLFVFYLILLSLQIMRETLIYLSHLDHEDTEKQV